MKTLFTEKRKLLCPLRIIKEKVFKRFKDKEKFIKLVNEFKGTQEYHNISDKYCKVD